MRNILGILTILILLIGCSSPTKKEIVISTNQWIGYAPLFYAYDKGYLKKLNIKIVTSASLAEAADIYRVGKADMVTTTQHEYHSLLKATGDIEPIILLDRSNGGDMVLSNKSIEELAKSKNINAYLEVDSINREILEDFISNNALNLKKFTILNKDQRQMQDIKYTSKKPIVIVTYSPYNIALKKKGFKEVASTKDIDSIIVIDALCTKKELIKNDKQRLIKLKHILDKAIDEIRENPKQSHKIISKYISNMSYDDYLKALNNIKWINKPSKKLLNFISKYDYTEKTLIIK
ncbi:ABC transporter substrate-binding protein [Sulfurimonas sp.]